NNIAHSTNDVAMISNIGSGKSTIITSLAKQEQINKKEKIYVLTGHSLGGAIASMLANSEQRKNSNEYTDIEVTNNIPLSFFRFTRAQGFFSNRKTKKES